MENGGVKLGALSAVLIAAALGFSYRPSALEAASTSIAQDFCDTACLDCPTSTWVEVYYNPTWDYDNPWVGNRNCQEAVPGPCTLYECSQTEDAVAMLPALKAAVDEDDVVSVLEVIRRSGPDVVAYNARRNAIQIAGCRNGTVVAHVPIRSPTMMAALQEELPDAEALQQP